ncbi:MAG: ferredoxin family protein [Deltaproteobacteria bacterium]
MAGMFIDVKVDATIASDAAIAKKLVEVCAVDIFALTDAGGVTVVEANLDECVLCDLCVEAAPKGKVQVIKLY